MSSTFVLRNLTPHAVVLHLVDGTVCELPPEPPAPRCVVARSSAQVVRTTVGEVRLAETALRPDVVNLPAAQEGVLLIVPSRVADARPQRADLVFPDELVRDAAGGVVACRSLARLPVVAGGERWQIREVRRATARPSGPVET